MSGATDAEWAVDPDEWKVERFVEIDDVFIAEATAVAARKRLDVRIAKVQRARDLMRRAHRAVMASLEEVGAATDLLEEALRQVAKAKDADRARR